MLQSADYWVSVHNLRTIDGGILDPDDSLIDVVDDREQVNYLPCPVTQKYKSSLTKYSLSTWFSFDYHTLILICCE